MTRGLGERLRWLFEVVAAPVSDVDGDTRWRAYTEAELAEHIASTLGEDQAAGVDIVERVRGGGPVRREQLAAIADFFGVAVEFLEGVEDVEVFSDAILARALRECGVWAHWICRTEPPAGERRVQVQTALRELRRPLSTHWWHDDQHQLSTQYARDSMTEAQLRDLCRNLVDDLELRTPFRPDELVARLGERRGRRIRVRAVDLGGTTGVGHLVPTRRADRILVDHAAPAAQRDLVIYHEIIHLVRGHLATDESVTCGVISGTTGRPSWREWEAEVGARELAALARSAPRPNQLIGAGPAERSIAAAFGFAEGAS